MMMPMMGMMSGMMQGGFLVKRKVVVVWQKMHGTCGKKNGGEF